MMYVLAVEEDGYMRDVTARYAKQYSAKVSKVQSGGRGRREWWAQVVHTVTRPYKLVREPGSTFDPNLMASVAEAPG
jgi:xeroderma pigmentosum group C-complementing protein